MSRPVQARSRRGQPLMVYALLIVGWVGVRSVLWDSPLPDALAANTDGELVAEADVTATGGAAGTSSDREMSPPEPDAGPWRSQDDWRIVEPLDRGLFRPVAYSKGNDLGQAPIEFGDSAAAAGHQLMWMAAMAHFPVPRGLHGQDSGVAAPPASPWLPLAKSRGQKRWSIDAWVFLRENSATLLNQPGVRPSYGRSQQGAVVRYRLADTKRHEPSLYARYTRALAGDRATDLAAGVEAKPFAKLPLRAHAELRATRSNGRTDWRPAAFVTAGVYEQLPLGLTLRGYGQAGYVGGDFATAFIDGQAVADREVAKFDLGRMGEGKVNLGGGVWGGAQKGAERVDIGPSANVVVPVNDAPVRLQLDYRLRVAGDAQPDSGMALTLSTGF